MPVINESHNINIQQDKVDGNLEKNDDKNVQETGTSEFIKEDSEHSFTDSAEFCVTDFGDGTRTGGIGSSGTTNAGTTTTLNTGTNEIIIDAINSANHNANDDKLFATGMTTTGGSGLIC